MTFRISKGTLAATVIPGVLRDFDVADIPAPLAPRPVLMINPQDALEEWT